MAHFDLIRPIGQWVLNSVLSHDELKKIDESLVKCLNADDGGLWAPTTPITIGGQGGIYKGNLTCEATSNFLCKCGATFQQPVLCESTLHVEGDVTFDGTLHVAFALSCSAGITGTNVASTAGMNVGTALVVGTTITVGTNATVTGTLGVGGACSCGSTLTVAGQSTFNGLATCNAGLNVASGAFDVHSTSGHFHNDLSVDRDAEIGRDLTVDRNAVVSGTFEAQGAATFDAATNLNGNTSLTKPMTVSGAGQIVNRFAVGADGNVPYTVVGAGGHDEILVGASTLTTDRTYTLDETTPPPTGSRIRITNLSTSYKVDIYGSVRGLIISVKNGTGFSRCVELVFDGTYWEVTLIGHVF